MRVNKKQTKKKIIFVLLVALMVMMVQPPSSYADELEDGTTPSEITPTATTDQDNPNTSETNSETSPITPKSSGTEPQMTESTDELHKQSDNILEEDSSNKDIGEPIAQASNFEATAPEISKIVFDQNHTTVESDATLTFSIYVYDDSEISNVRVWLGMKNTHTINTSEWHKGTEDHEYICTYQLDGKTVGKIYVHSVEVVDEHGNKTTNEFFDYETEISQYWVDIVGTSEPIQVKEFYFPQNGTSIEKINFSGMFLTTREAIEDDTIYLSFENNSENIDTYIAKLSTDGGNRFSWSSYSYSNNLSIGEYVLKEAYVTRGSFSINIPVDIENPEKYSFTLTTENERTNLKITSIQLDKNGQTVKPSDKVEITIEAESLNGIELPQYGSAHFLAAAPNIEPASKWVNLELKTDNKYHGTLMTNNLYPCEWYLDSLYFDNAYYDDGSYTYNANYPYYIQVYSGESFVNPTFNVGITFIALDENGSYTPISNINKTDIQRRQTFKEAGIEFPEKTSKYPELTQTGWMDSNGNDITEDTQLLWGGYIEIYAKYDKGVLQAIYDYPGNDGTWKSVSKTIFYDYGQTYKDLAKNAQEFIPEDITKDYTFSNWELPAHHSENEVIVGDKYIPFTARFADTITLKIQRSYYDEKGEGQRGFEFLAVKEGTQLNDVVNMLKESEQPKMYKGLRFKEWDVSTYTDEDVLENGMIIHTKAICENYLVRYIINPDDDIGGTIFCQLAEPGEEITALTSFDGFGEVTWYYDYAPDKTFVVNSDMTFWGGAEEISSNPSKPSKPSSSTSGSGNKPDITPDSKLPDSVVNSVIEEIKTADPGKTININMNEKTTISKEILEAAKGKDVNLILEMDGYSWTINGKDIHSGNLQDIDLKVIKNTNNIPNSTVKALAGDNPCMQITLAHEGYFGFKATLNIGVGAEHVGKYGNLYYHDSVGKMVFINAGQIDSEGNVSLMFSHASNYLLVMSDQIMSQADVPSNLMPTDTYPDPDGNTTVKNVNSNVRKSAKTGDYNTIYLWVLLCVAAIGTFVYASSKRQA